MTEYPVPNPGNIAGDDVAFGRYLVSKIGVAAVPGSSFYRPDAPEGRKLIRFNFSKKNETLLEAGRRLLKLHAKV